MQTHRCPECGNRLTSNYCDICMRRVPFAGLRSNRDRDPWDSSSAHRQEKDHTCVTFDKPKPVTLKPVFQKKSNKQMEKKMPALALILAAVSLIGLLGDLREDFNTNEPVPEPEYNAEAFSPEADLPVFQPETLEIGDEIFITSETMGQYYDEPALSFVVDNKSDMDIDVTVEQVAVNGYMIDAGMSMEIPAEESCQGFLCLYRYDLEKVGIQQISQIDLRLRVYDRAGYQEIYYLDLWTLQADTADNYTPSVDRSGWEMIRDSGLSVRLQDVQLYGNGSFELLLHLENLSEDTVSLYPTAVSVNGQEAECSLWATLLPGTCAVGSVYIDGLYDQDMEELSRITEIDLQYVIEYSNGYELIDMVEGSVLFNPNALPASE